MFCPGMGGLGKQSRQPRLPSKTHWETSGREEMRGEKPAGIYLAWQGTTLRGFLRATCKDRSPGEFGGNLGQGSSKASRVHLSPLLAPGLSCSTSVCPAVRLRASCPSGEPQPLPGAGWGVSEQVKHHGNQEETTGWDEGNRLGAGNGIRALSELLWKDTSSPSFS